MKTHSQHQSHTPDSGDRLVASIPARPFSDAQFEQPDTQTHDFSQVDLFSHAPQRGAVQPKLTVGQPNDVYEQEADQVASQVMGMPDTATQQPIQREGMPESELQAKPLAASVTPLIQREAAPESEPDEAAQMKPLSGAIQREAEGAEAEEEELQMKPLSGAIQREAEGGEAEEEELQMKPLSGAIQREAEGGEAEEEELQMKPLSGAIQREGMPEDEELQAKSSPTPQTPHPTPALETQLANTQGNGSPLPDDVRSFMEPRFGADFSQVRVHTGNDSVQMNQDLQAQAFTHKQDIYFGAGKAPSNDALTAHELTHVIQQNGAIAQQQADR